MRRLLLVFVIGFVVSWNLKGNMGITVDNQVHVGSWTMSVPAAVQASPVYGLLTSMMIARQPGPVQATTPANPAAVWPSMPVINSAAGTYNGDAPAGRPANIAGQFDATARAISGPR